MRILLLFTLIGLFFFACSPRKYNYVGADFSLYEESEEPIGNNQLRFSNEGCYDFRLDSITISTDGVQIPWVRIAKRSSDYADGIEFNKFYSYISFIDEKRVVIYAPFKAAKDNRNRNFIDFKEGTTNFDYLRGYYSFDGKSKIQVEVENKKRKELIFFTFKAVVDSIRIKSGYIQLEGGAFTKSGNELRKADSGNILVKGGKLNTEHTTFRLPQNESSIDPLGKLNLTSNKDFLGELSETIEIGKNKILVANDFKLSRSGNTIGVNGKLTIKDGLFAVDIRASSRNTGRLVFSEGIFHIEDGLLWTNKVSGLQLESLKIKNNAPIKGSYTDGFDYRYIHADSVFEFIPFYQAVEKKIDLYLDLPVGEHILIDSIKQEIDTINYYYDNDKIWKETKGGIKTW